MSKRLPSSAVSFIKTEVCQYEIGRAGAGAVLLIGLGYISPDSKLEGNRSKPVGVTVKKCKKAPLIGGKLKFGNIKSAALAVAMMLFH